MPRTFRVRGVPLDWRTDRLQGFLAEQDPSTSPVVESLASEIDGRSQTATATFGNIPSLLQTPGQTWSILLPKPSENPSARKQYLILDDSFVGITTLYSPPSTHYAVDFIALSGLGGHAFGSFKERGGEHMWLRDALPYDITHENTKDPMGRVMIYGYDSHLADSTSMQNLEDLATSFRDSLLPLVKAPTMKPIILVAHSLGGLIAKEALVHLSMSKPKNEDYAKLVQAVYGIVFFGVPHDGMDISSFIPMAGNQPNRSLIDSLSHINSQVLSTLQREFPKSLGEEGDKEIVCFYETEMSPTAKKDENGKWTMTGSPAILVTKSSATHCRQWEQGPEHI